MSLGRGQKGKGSKPRAGASRPARPSAEDVFRRRQLNNRRKNQAVRAAARASNPLPRPGPRAVPPPVMRRQAPAAEVDPLLVRFQSLENEFLRVDREANLEDIYQELGRIEEQFTRLPAQLDDLRRRGYVHAGQLEDRLESLDDEWDIRVRPTIERQLREGIFQLDRQLHPVQQFIGQMGRPSAPLLDQAESALQSARQAVASVRGSVSSLFQGTQAGLGEVQVAVHRAEWMIQHLEQSPEIKLHPAEGPLLAVEAEWEQDGKDDGPDGILYLTDQRLLFEQKEEVATKKFLFITTDSEVLQKLLIDVPVREIQEVAHAKEGRGFLSMRKDDILELIFSASAPMSRARFHILGHESAAWAAMIKRVQTGEIDRDRAEAFVEEAETAAASTAALPEKCPFCFAAIPIQPRGVSRVVCDFCGSTVTATRPPAGT